MQRTLREQSSRSGVRSATTAESVSATNAERAKLSKWRSERRDVETIEINLEWRDMTKLTLTTHVQGNTTLLENEFIDTYMPKANGEYVKVYLLLLRYMNNPSMELSISKIADILDDTEKDVLRALKYWQKEGLLDCDLSQLQSRKQTETGTAAATPEPAASEPVSSEPTASASPAPLSAKKRKELKQILFIAEQYLGKTLSSTEAETITYFFTTLGMSSDLIDYLIEYCVENGHKSIHYIKKVALSWHDQNITTTEQAKNHSVLYNKNCYSILNAYGIKGRAPAASETEYIRRWNDEYGLALELILEACDRTMNAIHQPSFEYTESILKKWMEKGVHNLKDVQALDEAYLKEKENKKQESAARRQNNGTSQTFTRNSSKNKFNNFEGRTYQDMDELTRRLIKTQ